MEETIIFLILNIS